MHEGSLRLDERHASFFFAVNIVRILCGRRQGCPFDHGVLMRDEVVLVGFMSLLNGNVRGF